jgi:predicted dehydrogenase
MKALVVGLGSMGKRRVRCLKSLGFSTKDILGFDLKEDRRQEVKEKYDVEAIGSLDKSILSKIDVMIISVPPDIHNQYIKMAIENKKPAFVEASVILPGLKDLEKAAKKQNVLIAPSCTLRFHPAIKDITKIVKSGKYGKVTNFTYHSGQYLPDWHPWEAVKDYYVGKKETGGCREIIPFELTWIVDVIGFPKRTVGVFGKTMDVGAAIDDTYIAAMDFGDVFGALTVDVVSRYATRSLILNMEQGQILWRWDDNVVKLYNQADQKWQEITYKQGQSAEGYNRNIAETMYIDELDTFLKAAAGKGEFPSTLEEDIKVLEILHEIEATK